MSTSKATQTYAEIAESILYAIQAVQTYVEVAESISYDAMAVQAYIEVAESTASADPPDPDLPDDVLTLPLGDGDVWTILD